VSYNKEPVFRSPHCSTFQLCICAGKFFSGGMPRQQRTNFRKVSEQGGIDACRIGQKAKRTIQAKTMFTVIFQKAKRVCCRAPTTKQPLLIPGSPGSAAISGDGLDVRYSSFGRCSRLYLPRRYSRPAVQREAFALLFEYACIPPLDAPVWLRVGQTSTSEEFDGNAEHA